MGTALGNEQQNYTNCINLHEDETYVESKEQYDNYGNIVYYYKKVPSNRNVIVIYNADQREIGSIERVNNCCYESQYILTDRNNNKINYIDLDYHCCSTTYTFLDSNKNIESVIRATNGCTITYEEIDNYNTRISTADTCLIHNGNPIYNEYDQYGNIAFRTKIFYQGGNKIIKIFDSNDNEVNLDNKSLINKGFTKIRMIILIIYLFI